jgi:hypothetical protein
MQKGGKVTLLKKGWVVTNLIDPGVTIAGGDRAVVGPSGYISNSNSNSGAAATTLNRKTRGAGLIVGQFDSLKDEDGYAKVSINLPQADANYYPNR